MVYVVYQLGENDFNENWCIGIFSTEAKAVNKMKESSWDRAVFLLREIEIDDVHVNLTTFDEDADKHNSRLFFFEINASKETTIYTAKDFDAEKTLYIILN